MEEANLEGLVGKENYNFVQINKSYIRPYRELIVKNACAAAILMFLIDKMGRTTNAVVCSYQTLQDVTGYKRSSIANAVKLLKEENWIESIKVGSATAYCVNARAFWQAARNQKQYAMFQATVIAGMDEQDSNFRDLAKHPLKHIPFINDNERAIISNEELPPPDQQEMNLN